MCRVGLQGRRAGPGGSIDAALHLADLLACCGKPDEAIAFFRALADSGDEEAASRLPDLLAHAGDLDEAIALLRSRADSGDENAADRLAELLAETGDDRLRRFGFALDGSIASGPAW